MNHKVDRATKVVLGWAVGDRAVTELALEAWEAAKATPMVSDPSLPSLTALGGLSLSGAVP
ncbi:MAG: hypothetical protein KAY24_08775 [Candidatus Eisenbacteria sp.]|nr:hypothetical protein [Candidatus Eisenbacteria bacterium]